VSTNSHAVGVPIDSVHNGGRPLVPLLDVVEKRRTTSEAAKTSFGHIL